MTNKDLQNTELDKIINYKFICILWCTYLHLRPVYRVFVCIYVYFTCNYIENQLEGNLHNKTGSLWIRRRIRIEGKERLFMYCLSNSLIFFFNERNKAFKTEFQQHLFLLIFTGVKKLCVCPVQLPHLTMSPSAHLPGGAIS